MSRSAFLAFVCITAAHAAPIAGGSCESGTLDQYLALGGAGCSLGKVTYVFIDYFTNGLVSPVSAADVNVLFSSETDPGTGLLTADIAFSDPNGWVTAQGTVGFAAFTVAFRRSDVIPAQFLTFSEVGLPASPGMKITLCRNVNQFCSDADFVSQTQAFLTTSVTTPFTANADQFLSSFNSVEVFSQTSTQTITRMDLRFTQSPEPSALFLCATVLATLVLLRRYRMFRRISYA
jgi:hypothetical protein